LDKEEIIQKRKDSIMSFYNDTATRFQFSSVHSPSENESNTKINKEAEETVV
jgi:hypothetical protein